MHTSDVFKAMAHPVRRDILRRLRAGELSAGALSRHYDMSKPSLSGHLKVLREAELVFVRRDGTTLYYALNTSVAEELMAMMMDLLGRGEGKADDTPDTNEL